MYCSKCKKEISDGSQFCKYCGNPIGNTISNDNLSNMTENRYKIHRYYWIIIVGILITILIFHPKLIMDFPRYTFGDFILDVIEHFDMFLIEIFGCVMLLGIFVFSTTEFIFKCPNCKEEIKLTRNKLEDVNDNTQTCKCPKCNKVLILSQKDKSVDINTNANNIENTITTNTNTSKLEELYNLKNKGIITEEDFENKKKEFLDKM